jgi:hypothetical protein
LESALVRAGLRLASWTRRGFDTVTHDPAKVAGRLTRGLSAGDILLLHDGAKNPAVVLEALPRLLEGVASAGLSATPLSDDLGEAPHA